MLHFSCPLKFYSLCGVLLELSRIYTVLMLLSMRVHVGVRTCVFGRGGRGAIAEERKIQIQSKQDM